MKYKNTYLTNKNSDLFLIVYPLITFNNIIKGSWHIGLTDINVKPAAYNKMYMEQSLVEAAWYCLVSHFKNRIISHKNLCRSFLDQIHLFQHGNSTTCKVLFVNQINNICGALETRVSTEKLEPFFSFFEPDSYPDHNTFLNDNTFYKPECVLFRYWDELYYHAWGTLSC